MRLNLESLICDLPEDILKKKWAGDFEGEKRLIEKRLAAPGLGARVKDRLIIEKALIDRLPGRFPYTREQAMDIMRARVRDFTEEEFDALEDEGIIEFIYVCGQRRYLRSFAGTLTRVIPALKPRLIKPQDESDTRLTEAIAHMKRYGELIYRFKVKSEIQLDEREFIPGETYVFHLPVPAACAQQREEDIRVRADADCFIAPPGACQRTVSASRKLKENAAFGVEYEFTNRMVYVDTRAGKPFIAYPDAGAPTPDDVSEQLPHIAFTPMLRALASEIASDETDNMRVARKFYDYITKNVRYSYMRSYILIDRHAEYCALNLKGDCGIQAILFITLCRIAGIPARWQSGLTIERDGTGNHDWAQFYTPEYGWLFADPSFGGGAWREGDTERHDFYFGNLDPFRMIANRRYQTNFEPAKAFERFDPYDNQDGEIECSRAGFDAVAFETKNSVLAYERVGRDESEA